LESYLNREKIKNKKREEPVMSEIKDEIYEEEDHIFEVEAEGKNSVRTQDKTTPDKEYVGRRGQSETNALVDILVQLAENEMKYEIDEEDAKKQIEKIIADLISNLGV
jgi:hypothetical protein